jgi:cytochrome P450
MPDQPQAHFDFARRLRAHKLRDLGDDLLSHILQSDLSPTEQEAIIFVMLSSGRDSVAYFITTSVLALLKNPEQLKKFISDFEQHPGSIDELVRYGTMFVTLFPRTANQDIEVCGYQIRAGESVSVSAVAANRDPDKFLQPDHLNLERESAGHLGFGQGAHACIGQQYARMILSTAIPKLLRHFESSSLVQAEQDEPMTFAHPIATYKSGSLMLRAQR